VDRAVAHRMDSGVDFANHRIIATRLVDNIQCDAGLAVTGATLLLWLGITWSQMIFAKSSLACYRDYARVIEKKPLRCCGTVNVLVCDRFPDRCARNGSMLGSK
jgi:hypothetical protein